MLFFLIKKKKKLKAGPLSLPKKFHNPKFSLSLPKIKTSRPLLGIFSPKTSKVFLFTWQSNCHRDPTTPPSSLSQSSPYLDQN
jgi:hypothetical protein